MRNADWKHIRQALRSGVYFGAKSHPLAHVTPCCPQHVGRELRRCGTKHTHDISIASSPSALLFQKVGCTGGRGYGSTSPYSGKQLDEPCQHLQFIIQPRPIQEDELLTCRRHPICVQYCHTLTSRYRFEWRRLTCVGSLHSFRLTTDNRRHS
jgi:hypothetical protein